jgi:predicted GNAT family N-acyltransferase
VRSRRSGDAVAYVDARAAGWIAQAAPIRFGVARSPVDLEAVYRLRHDVAIAEGWMPPGAFPDGLEHDTDDPEAVQVAGWDDERIVATARLVPTTPGRSLPTESAFQLTVPDRDRVVEVGRVCVAAPYREVGRGVFIGLLGQIWIEMRRRGYADACGSVTIEMARLYAKLVGCVVLLAPPRTHWGQRRFAARVSPAVSPTLVTTSAMGTLWPEDGEHLVGVGDPPRPPDRASSTARDARDPRPPRSTSCGASGQPPAA